MKMRLRTLITRGRAERGAVLVHFAIAGVGLIAISALSIDYGVMWMSRRQVQNAADAGALAGAISLAFDSPTDFPRARDMASTLGRRNGVFGAQPVIDRANDVSFPTGPACTGTYAVPDTCVKVNAYRNQAKSNALPTFMARVWGRTDQGVQATATAQIATGNATNCMKPWAIADKWAENIELVCNNGGNNCSWQANSTWDFNKRYNHWSKGTGGNWIPDPDIPVAPGPDVYIAPTSTNGGTGFAPFNANGSYRDYGTYVRMKLGSNNDSSISSGWFLSLNLSDSCTATGCPTGGGSTMYSWAIKNCIGGNVAIGSTIPVETGNMVGPTDSSVYGGNGNGQNSGGSIVQADPGAYWDASTRQIRGSCAGTGSTCPDGNVYTSSPRIVPVAVFDVDAYLSAGYNGSNGSVIVRNILGFFVLTETQAQSLNFPSGNGNGNLNGNTNGEVYGVLVSVPGLTSSGGGSVPQTSSFLRQVILVR